MVAELKEKFGADKIDIELIEGSGGQFEIELDGQQIYSKKVTGSFPRYQEIPLKIEMKAAGM